MSDTTDSSPKPRYRLRLESLKFISAVDRPAQETALAAVIKRAGNQEDLVATCKVAKVADELGIVFGYALTCTVDGEPYHDLQGDAISEAELIKVAAEYLTAGAATDAMHDEKADGRTIFAFPLTSELAKAFDITTSKTGLLVGIRPSAEVLAKFKSGEYTGFSIGGAGVREQVGKTAATAVAKRSLLTSAQAGHTHLIYNADDSMSGQTSSERIYNAGNTAYDSYHSHPWVRSDAGVITIGEAAGHTHDVADADSVAKRNKETAMAEKTDDIEKLKADLAARDTELAAAKAEVEKLTKAAKPADDDPVVYTTTDGTAIRKSAGDVSVMLAKKLDEQAATIAKRDAEIALAQLQKRAEVEIPHLPGTAPERAELLKAIDAIADEPTRKRCHEIVRGGDSAVVLAKSYEAAGHGGGPIGTAEQQLDILAKKYEADHKVPFAKAYAAVLSSAEGRALYAQIPVRSGASTQGA